MVRKVPDGEAANHAVRQSRDRGASAGETLDEMNRAPDFRQEAFRDRFVLVPIPGNRLSQIAFRNPAKTYGLQRVRTSR